MKKTLVAGLVAHVDSGKTTLAEGILYTCGKKRELGRVDHKDTLLDNTDIERERGITVFAKQARVTYNEVNITLLDTPGHVDFSAEMERTLQVIDAAVLLISGDDPISGHTFTLWKLLESYSIPTIIFVNKIDMAGFDRQSFYSRIKTKLSDNIVDFNAFSQNHLDEKLYDELSMCDEIMMEEYLECGSISVENMRNAYNDRRLFPLIFGSALLLDGVDRLLNCLTDLCKIKEYKEEFSARVYKISRDASGRRLTHIKLTGGRLKVRDKIGDEKVDQIRIYNGAQFDTVDEMNTPDICVLTGLEKCFVGDRLGSESGYVRPLMLPILSYRVIPDEREDKAVCFKNLVFLSEELPELNVTWQESSSEIHISVMGDVQNEILKRMYHDRFDRYISIDDASVVYKETISHAVHGIGHYEPLKHYSEVHLLISPLPQGSGIEYDTCVSSDELDINWVRLILTHLKEKKHKGVLTGSELTDVRFTVIGGRAHAKHTEGGDFRQSTYRAVRQGLMSAESILLEPYIDFTLRVPTDQVGRAMTDIKKYEGSFEPPENDLEDSIIRGSAPAATMFNYSRELSTYSRGRGNFSFEISGYRPCHNMAEVTESIAYDPEADTENPSSSVFCSHGAGYVVPWYEVPQNAHVDCSDRVATLTGNAKREYENIDALKPIENRPAYRKGEMSISIEEIEKIYKDTYHKSSEELTPYRYIGYESKKKPVVKSEKEYVYKPRQKKESFLLVDGYNIIFANEKLSSIADKNLDGARDALIDICINYQGSMGMTLILVFDAYKVKGNPGSVQKVNNIYVVYTKEAETADQYIEKTVHVMANSKNCDIMVATSDRLEQMIIYGDGAVRISALEFMKMVEAESERLRKDGFVH
ncbi:MAG: TetM/TetW/TetO/TetS family tetracycline resistance ribosomal protection protein [Lachnospiraceae bacterium]|nr:TetM/TetW/TetO/TetS family tetracycline resistance ribosomal protection protein [Lachnospiraceae bacterium]